MGIRQSSEAVKSEPDQHLYDDFITNLISDNKIVMFSKTNCSYCHKAKNLLNNLKLDFKTIELDVKQSCPNENCQKLSTALIMQTRIRTVPQIFINGECVGGFNDLEALSRDETKFNEILNKK